MEKIFGDGLIIREDDNEGNQEEPQTPDSQPVLKSKKQRRWRPAWKFEHPWAYPIVDAGRLKIKCEWCAYSKSKTPFANKGSCTIQLPSLNEHSRSDEHKMAALKWANKENQVCIPLPDYVANFEDKEKVRVITVMWQVYFVVKCAGPMELFEKLCLHQIEQGLSNMPKHSAYGTYLNRISGMEFVQAIKDVLWNALCKEVQASPWYSMMVDDSTDRAKEGHMIVYINYLKDGGRGKRMDDLKLMEGALDLPELSMLRIHSVRWLSRGQVMERMVKVMPALIIEFGKESPNVVDIANISGYADATLKNLEKKFLRDLRNCGSKHLQKFVEQSSNREIRFFDVAGDLHIHELKFESIAGSSRGGSFKDCLQLGKELVGKIVENLRTRMQEDIPIFDACKLFSPKHYPSEELEMETCSKFWLGKLLSQFGSLVGAMEICMGELDSFTAVLVSNFKHKSFRDAWQVCKDDMTMQDSFPNLMKLWGILSVVPINSAVAERGFSLQNTIKTSQRTRMNIETLENFMFIGLHGPQNTSDLPWDDVFSLWSKKRSRSINISA
ncbi:hypothetical protein L7F22_062543 [Adiantum nelumboides]|nr:hypothetical protein [Adiantum nelumboides]